MRKTSRRWLAAVTMAPLLFAPVAAVALADDGEPEVGAGPRQFVKYSSCAGGLALAPNPGAAFAAFMVCLKMFMDEPL
ncbi:MAG: hypothetical protein IT347_04955 [Candidatus Eisenbacteria bacterium]|nr:hypothetical protein [Candidatus Eisenbacteria bacterium]